MCEHLNFKAAVDVHRLVSEIEPKQLVGFTADVRINCAECGIPFEFIGLPAGVSGTNTKPMVSVGGLELRAPIKPSTDAVDQFQSILNKKAK